MRTLRVVGLPLRFTPPTLSPSSSPSSSSPSPSPNNTTITSPNEEAETIPLTLQSTILYAAQSLPPLEPTQMDSTSVSFTEKLLYVWPTKASEHWTTWQTSNSKWKRHLHQFSHRFLERVAWQETMIKEWQTPQHIELICHPMYTDLIRSHFPEFLLQRQSYHQQRRWWCLSFLPFSAAFSIVPGPNLPLFYNLFRLHSHHLVVTHLKALPTEFTILENPNLPLTFPTTFDLNWLSMTLKQSGLTSDFIEKIAKAWKQELNSCQPQPQPQRQQQQPSKENFNSESPKDEGKEV